MTVGVEPLERERAALRALGRDDGRDAHAVGQLEGVPPVDTVGDACRNAAHLAVRIERCREDVGVPAARLLRPHHDRADVRRDHVDPHHVIAGASELDGLAARHAVVTDHRDPERLTAIGEDRPGQRDAR